MMYLLFLITYCYMLLWDYDKTIGTIEIVLFIWIATMIMEEMREVSSQIIASSF